MTRPPPPWKEENARLHAAWRFPDFAAALGFLVEVGHHAQAMNHHPDVHIHYDTLRFELWSHDEGRVTPRDQRLARRISTLARRHKAKKA